MWETKNLAYIEGLDLADWLLFGLYLSMILLTGYWIRLKNESKTEYHRYYFKGLLVKLMGGVMFVLVYIYYYKGGDTIAYYECARAFVNLLYDRPLDFFQVYFSGPSPENFSIFSSSTGYPWEYMYYDIRTLTVIKLITPLLIIGMSSFLLSTVLLSWVSFFALWKLYGLLCHRYPGNAKILFYAIFLLPSVLFWGSGLLKDSLTLIFSIMYIVAFYNIIIHRNFNFKGVFILLLSMVIIASIKPYILIALLPGSLIWIFFSRINAIKNDLLRYFVLTLIPIIILISGGAIQLVAGSSQVEELLQEASEKQRDLQKDYYQGSSFNIGLWEPNLAGALSVAPAAINAALYRPYFWESRNIVMLMSGFENLILLFLTFYIFYVNGFVGLMKRIINDPFMIFAIMYVFLFSLLVGLSTSNFGALVRFKIAYLPEFFIILILLSRKLPAQKKI